MREIMYDHSSFFIVGILFIGLLVAIEVGFRLGTRVSTSISDSAKGQIGAIQTSLLGVLALLLGFTFSLSLQRYDSRSLAVVSEANAIGTTILRANLLPESYSDQAKAILQNYLDLRVEAARISLDLADERANVLNRAISVQSRLWAVASAAASEYPNPVQTGLFLQALNEMIDAFSTRGAALDRHVPEIVLFLLFATFALTACLVGFSSGTSGHRTTFPTYVLVLLITFLVFLIIDLDRPRRGLIEVSQQSLLDLRIDP